MMSPQCLGGCAERPDDDPFHYYYHLKSAECDDPAEAARHQAAATWLRVHDLSASPYTRITQEYEPPVNGSPILPAEEDR
jgi:hypothetical protein